MGHLSPDGTRASRHRETHPIMVAERVKWDPQKHRRQWDPQMHRPTCSHHIHTTRRQPDTAEQPLVGPLDGPYAGSVLQRSVRAIHGRPWILSSIGILSSTVSDSDTVPRWSSDAVAAPEHCSSSPGVAMAPAVPATARRRAAWASRGAAAAQGLAERLI